MERHTRSSILYGISGTLGLLIAGASLYTISIGLTIPTVTEDYTNKLLFYNLILVLFAWKVYDTFFGLMLRQYGKVRLHWHLRNIKRKDDAD